jgi:hypothetical protein
MISAFRSKLTYANIAATLALFIALGGSSYAAISLSNNSVKSKHIAKGAVKRSDIAKNAVNTSKVADASLLATDFASGQLPGGPKGDKGDKGDPGQEGAPGAARAYAFGGGDLCPGTAPPFVACPVVRGKGVAYIVKVATGVYCVGVTGIDAAAPDSVAIVTAATGSTASQWVARWRSQNSACVSSEFEVSTIIQGTISARNSTDTGSVTVAAPASFSDGIRFVIAIL